MIILKITGRSEVFMEYEKHIRQLLSALSGFHGRFKKMFGQAALRIDSSTYLMTDLNVQLSTITEDNILICDMSSGELGTLFRRLPDANAIIVGCSQDTVNVSMREKDLPVMLEDLAQLTGPYLQIVPDLSPDNIVKAMNSSTVCLVRGVGVFAAASNPRKAVAGTQIVEKACEAQIHGEMIGGVIPIPEETAAASKKEFESDYVNRNESKDVAYMRFEEEDFSLRSQLIEGGKELVMRDLAYGSWGNLSVRLNDREMLITPSSMDYFDIKPEDIVRMDINTLEYGAQRIPSGTSGIHAAVYRELPDCSVIIHTHSNALAVFAACRAGFTITEPDMHNLIGDILVAGNDENIGLAENIAKTLTKTHAAIIPNHGAIFTGPSLDIVLAIAEAVELRARTLLNFDTRLDSAEE